MARRKKPKRGKQRLLRLLAALFLTFLSASLLLTLPFRWLAPPTTAFMLHAGSAGLGGGQPCPDVDYVWVDREAIAPAMPLAVIAAEDQRFPHHWGLDTGAIASALQERLTNGRGRGASTLSQQLVKNLYLWPDQSWLRKGVEAWLTVLLELTWSKQRILEVYLNVVQFGECTFGVQAASRRFFQKNAAALSDRQAARLAAVLPGPVIYRVDRPGEYVRQRTDWILEQMKQLGGNAYLRLLSATEHAETVRNPIKMTENFTLFRGLNGQKLDN